MHDTPHEIEMRMQAMLAERTPAERLRMASQMFDTGLALLKAGIKQDTPDISEAELRCEIFRRLYGDCFSAEESRQITGLLLSNTR